MIGFLALLLRQMTSWLLLCFALLAVSKFACPFIDGNSSALATGGEQRLLRDCEPVTIKGFCDENLDCIARTHQRRPCAAKLPCLAHKQTCTCPNTIACQRLSAPLKQVTLMCIDDGASQEHLHPKRQESHDDEDAGEDDTTEIDGTLVFVLILLLSYCVILCLFVIYIKPVD